MSKKVVVTAEKHGPFWYLSGAGVDNVSLAQATEDAIYHVASDKGIYNRVKLTITDYKPHRYDRTAKTVPSNEAGFYGYQVNGISRPAIVCHVKTHRVFKCRLNQQPRKLWIQVEQA